MFVIDRDSNEKPSVRTGETIMDHIKKQNFLQFGLKNIEFI